MERQSVVIPLSYPVEAHGETLTSLTFQEPLGNDMVSAGSPNDPGWDHRLCAVCCGIPPSAVQGMRAIDVFKLMRQLNAFLEEPAGSASSTTTLTADTPGTTSDAS